MRHYSANSVVCSYPSNFYRMSVFYLGAASRTPRYMERSGLLRPLFPVKLSQASFFIVLTARRTTGQLFFWMGHAGISDASVER